MATGEPYRAEVLGPPSGFTVEVGDPYFDEVRRKTVQVRRKAAVGEVVEVSAERLRRGVEEEQLKPLDDAPAEEDLVPVESAREVWSKADSAIAWAGTAEDLDELAAMGEHEETHRKRITVMRAIADRMEVVEAAAQPGQPGAGTDGDSSTTEVPPTPDAPASRRGK